MRRSYRHAPPSRPDDRDPAKVAAADEYFRRFEPRLAATLRSTVAPNIVTGGNRINVIPSETMATLDTRVLPDEDIDAFVDQVRQVVNVSELHRFMRAYWDIVVSVAGGR